MRWIAPATSRRRAAVLRGLLAGLAATLPMLTGCARINLDRLTLGQELRQPQRVFPEGRALRTDVGLCYLERDRLGRTDAIVVLLTRDQRVAGKLHACLRQRRGGSSPTIEYHLRGEFDPQLVGLSGTGPIDTLRAIADELTSHARDGVVREAHGLIAAGMVRMVQQWPHADDEGPTPPRLAELLERVPPGGEAKITVRRRGTRVIEYHARMMGR